MPSLIAPARSQGPLTPLRSAPHHELALSEGAHMGIPLSDEIKKLLDRPNFVHLSRGLEETYHG